MHTRGRPTTFGAIACDLRGRVGVRPPYPPRASAASEHARASVVVRVGKEQRVQVTRILDACRRRLEALGGEQEWPHLIAAGGSVRADLVIERDDLVAVVRAEQ